MVSQACYSPNDGRRYSRACPPYLPYHERQFQLPSHDARALTMTDSQADDSTPPRKRIAVACSRCRKRKIRCSGDPGHGLSCSNCKNAGVEPCLFLRVSSTETMLRDNGEYHYNLDAARALASRGSVSHLNTAVSHYQELPNMAPSDVMTSYRGSQPYPYGGKTYYPVAGWTGAYPDDNVDFSLNCQSYPMLNNDPVHMVPYQAWPSRSKSAASGNMYVDPEASYPYNNTANLVHRPATTSESANFSFSNVAASLPSTGTERLLPNPAMTRTLTSSSSTSTYRGEPLPSYSSSKSSAAADSIHTSPISSMSEASPRYGSAFDSSSLGPYPTSGPALPSQHGRTSRSVSEAYNSPGERIFGAEERLNIGSQGSAVDMTGYTYSGSGSGSIRRTSGPELSSRAPVGEMSNGQAYMPSEEVADSVDHAHEHHSVPVAGNTTSVGYPGEVPSSAGGRGSSGGGGTSTDSRRPAVASRR